MERAIPALDEEELEQGMKLANQQYLSQGITSLQDTTWNNRYRRWQTWRQLVDRGIVSPRVSMLAGTESLEEFREVGLSTGSGDGRLRLGGFKLALDECTGCLHPPQEDITRLALRAHSVGFQVAFHVSDLRMLQAALTAIRAVREAAPATEHRFRLEHCPVCPPGWLFRVKSSQTIVVAQPSFVSFMGQRYREQVPPHQAGSLWPFGSFQRWGVRVAFSSDSPLGPSDPLAGISAAITRRVGSDMLAPQETISALQALRMYTLGGAYASFEEDTKGSISPGKLADLAVLSGDLTQLTPERKRDLQVVRTIVDGQTVWER